MELQPFRKNRAPRGKKTQIFSPFLPQQLKKKRDNLKNYGRRSLRYNKRGGRERGRRRPGGRRGQPGQKKLIGWAAARRAPTLRRSLPKIAWGAKSYPAPPGLAPRPPPAHRARRPAFSRSMRGGTRGRTRKPRRPRGGTSPGRREEEAAKAILRRAMRNPEEGLPGGKEGVPQNRDTANAQQRATNAKPSGRRARRNFP